MMATGFDELVEQLLYDVALTGSQGLGADELESAVQAFYDSRKQTRAPDEPEEDALLFSDAPPTSSIVIDHAFLNAVWDWLQKHPEIEIKTFQEEEKAESEATSEPTPTERRIFTTEERTWQTIAGHGVDYSRLPRLSFDCLSVIASHGPNGVLQPTLTQITGQDKRSVPGRTDILAENGYIVKLQAYDGKHKTSLLKLRKFAEADGTLKPISTLERTRIGSESLVEQSKSNSGRTFDEVIEMLKENRGIVAIVDLCKAYKLRKHTTIKRDFLRSLDRLVESGCARQVTAQIESGNNRYTMCLQLVREPTEKDRETFTGESTHQAPANSGLGGSVNYQTLDENESIGDGEDQNNGDNVIEEVETKLVQRVPPQWTTDVPQNNLVFKIIHEAGPIGISSMELHRLTMGSFWKKGLDDLLLRLTDVWEVSQPLHLRHLGIVRDTEISGKSAHFHFRTLPNFEKAVEMGLTAWEAVTGTSKVGGKKVIGKPTSLSKTPALDQFGFPKIDPKLFADEEGRASLAECAKFARRGRPPGTSSNKKGNLQKAKNTPTKLTNLTLNGKSKRRIAGKSSNSKETPLTVSTETPSTTPLSKRTLATGRRKRKDAGVKKGPRRSELLSTPTVTTENEILPDDEEEQEVDPFTSTKNTTMTPTVSGEKRSAETAQFNFAFRKRKVRKVEVSLSTSQATYDSNENFGAPPQDADLNEENQEVSNGSKVSINLPSAVKSRFEGWGRPGRKPFTKIVTIKSQRLRDLPFFGSDATIEKGQDSRPIEVDQLSNYPPQTQAKTSQLANDTSQKKRKFNDGILSFSKDNSGDSAVATPAVKKRRGRPPKHRLDSTELPARTPIADASTAHMTTLAGLENSAPIMPRSLVAKLSLRRSLLEAFIQERSDSIVRGPESTENRSRVVTLPLSSNNTKVSDSTVIPRRIVTLPLLRTAYQDIQHDEVDDEGVQNGESPLSLNESSARATSVSGASRKNLIVKLNLPLSRSPVVTESPGHATTLITSSAPPFGLNIVKPYLVSTTSIRAEDAVSGKEIPGQANIGSGIPRSGPTGTEYPSHENDITTVDAEDVIDGSDSLSELLPAEVDQNDGYRASVTQKAGTPRQGGFIHLRRMKIVMETMDKAGGVFPGDHEMYFPFVTAWQKTYALLPDRRTVDNTVNSLVRDGKLNKFSFAFKDKHGKTLHRHIIATPEISPSSALAKQVQQSIINSYPFRYLPKQVNIAKHLRDRARQTPVTQGGTRPADEDDTKDKDPTYTPMRSKVSTPSTAKRSGASVSFDLKTTVGLIQTPRVERLASFTPRSILKVKDDVNQPIDLEDDDFGSTSGNETETESDSDDDDDNDDDDSLFEVSSEQAALQGSFGLDRYQHIATKTPRKRQGTRAMRTLKTGAVGAHGSSTPTTAPRWLLSSIAPNEHFIQIFHSPSGTFGTLYERRLKTGRPRKNASAIALTSGIPFSVPQGLRDIQERSLALGRMPANPTDSRFHHFKIEVDNVSEWEQSMTHAERTMERLFDAVFINHHLKQQHFVSPDANAEFHFEFVDGLLKPFDLENELRKRPQTTKMTTTGTINAAVMAPLRTQYVSPYRPVHVSPPTFGHSPLGTVLNLSASFVPSAPSAALPILPLRYGGMIESTETYLDHTASARSGKEKTKRHHVYKTRNKDNRRSALDITEAISQFEDQDSDGDYRPGLAVVSKKKSPATSTGTKHAGKKQPHYQRFTPDEFKRLALAVALARTICGGISTYPTMNYEAVALALGSRYGIEELKYHWQLPRKHGYDLTWAKKVHQTIYEPFLEAYEAGELPRVDFDDLQGTDWPGMLGWVESTTLPLVEGENLELPNNRNSVQAVSLADSTNLMNEINPYFDLLETKEDQAAAPVRKPGHNKPKASSTLDQNFILEKSWVRAVMVTAEDMYDENRAATKLRSLPASTLEKATQQMLETKMIKWKKTERQQPGRSYDISPYAMTQFDRWPTPDQREYLTDLMVARNCFVNHFQQHDNFELTENVTEAEITVLSNMVTQGHLSMVPLLPERNDDLDAPWPKLSKWGPINGAYASEQRDMPSLGVKVLYKKTPLFTADHDLKVGVAIPTEVQIIAGELGMRIPFWIDINGAIINSVWDKVVKSILYLLVHAPGSTAKSIERTHDSKLWGWEVDIVLGWMEEVGLATRNEVEGCGWRASEWWYCVSALTKDASNTVTDEEAVEV